MKVLLLVFCGWAILIEMAEGEVANNSISYQLDTDTTYLQGCFPPCLCPLRLGVPIKGSFLLTPTGFDGLYNSYAVTNVSWLFWINGTNLFVTGSGTYKVGGEVALQQELALDLRLGAGLVQHFDSGLVATTTPFPDIKVAISVNGQVCNDKVFNVNASPVPVPPVQLTLAGNNSVVLSWPVSAAPFVLQQSSDLTTGSWTVVTNTPTNVGQQYQVTLSRAAGSRFYRLAPSAN